MQIALTGPIRDVSKRSPVLAHYPNHISTNSREISTTAKRDHDRQYSDEQTSNVASDKISQKPFVGPLETNLDDLSSCGGSQSTLASGRTDSEADVSRQGNEHNNNKVFELRVDQKGNVERISVVEDSGATSKDYVDRCSEGDIFVKDDEDRRLSTPTLRRKETGSQTGLADEEWSTGKKIHTGIVIQVSLTY